MLSRKGLQEEHRHNRLLPAGPRLLVLLGLRGLARPRDLAGPQGMARLRGLAWGLILTLVFLAGGAPVAAGGPFSDVAADHWSYEVVERLSAKGWIEGYTPGTFRSSRLLTRYEMALIVARMVDKFEAVVEGRDPADGAVQAFSDRRVSLPELFAAFHINLEHLEHKDTLTSVEMHGFQDLAEEFQSELSVLGYEVVTGPLPLDTDTDTGTMVGTLDPWEGPLIHGIRLEGGIGDKLWQSTSRHHLRMTEGPAAEAGEPLAVLAVSRDAWLDGHSLGRLGSTLLLSGTGSSEGLHPLGAGMVAGPRGSLDGTIQVSERVLIGGEAYPHLVGRGLVGNGQHLGGGSMVALGGNFPVAPNVTLAGEYRQNPFAENETGVGRVGGSIRLGPVELGGEYRSVSPQFGGAWDADPGEDATAYDLRVHFGDISLITGRDTIFRLGDGEERVEQVTSLGLRYDAFDGAMVQAQYRIVDLNDLRHDQNSGKTSEARLDMDLNIPGGKVRLGWSLEAGEAPSSSWSLPATTMASAGLEREVSDNVGVLLQTVLEDRDQGSTRTTSLGLRYNVGREAAVLLDYKLIDFGSLTDDQDDSRTNVTTAEFSIRF